jgi:single-stranded DNA-binding protein
MNTVILKGTLPRQPRMVEPTSDNKGLIALFTVACRNGDLGGLNFVEIKCFGEEALVANDRLTEKTEVEIRGYIRSESWQPKTKGAKKQYRQVVVAEYIQVLNGGLIVEAEEVAEALAEAEAQEAVA